MLARFTTLPFFVCALLCVVAGGLVSAVNQELPFAHGSWVVAYLVLVSGVAQGGLAAGQRYLAARELGAGVLAAEFALWNAGNALVITGTLLELVWMVDVGGVALVVALALAVYAVRGASGAPASAQRPPTTRHAPPRWLLPGYRALVVLLLVSIPVGLVLAAGHPA